MTDESDIILTEDEIELSGASLTLETDESDVVLTEDALEVRGGEIVATDPETDRVTVRIDLEAGTLAVDDEVQLATEHSANSALEIETEIIEQSRDRDRDDPGLVDTDQIDDRIPDDLLDQAGRPEPDRPDYLLSPDDVHRMDSDRMKYQLRGADGVRTQRQLAEPVEEIDFRLALQYLLVGDGFFGVKLNNPEVPAANDDDDGDETRWVPLERYVEDVVERALDERGIE